MKNKYIAVLLIILFTLVLAASPREGGIILGGGLSQGYGCRDQAEDYNLKIKRLGVFRAGIYSALDITPYLQLREEVLYSQKGSNQDISHKEEPVDFNVGYELSYLEIPVLLKQKFAETPVGEICGTAGISFSWLLTARYTLDGCVQVGDESYELKDSYRMDDLDEFDYSLLYGIGSEFDLMGKPVWLEYRFSMSWYKINFPTYEGEEPVQLSNQVHSLSISIKLL